MARLTPFHALQDLSRRLDSSAMAESTARDWSASTEPSLMVDGQGQPWSAMAVLGRAWLQDPEKDPWGSGRWQQAAHDLSSRSPAWKDPHSMGWLLAATCEPDNSPVDVRASQWDACLSQAWDELPVPARQAAAAQAMAHLDSQWARMGRAPSPEATHRQWLTAALECALAGLEMPWLPEHPDWPAWMTARAVEALTACQWLGTSAQSVENLLVQATQGPGPSQAWARPLARAALELAAAADLPDENADMSAQMDRPFLQAAAAIFAHRALRAPPPEGPFTPGQVRDLARVIVPALDFNGHELPFTERPRFGQMWRQVQAQLRDLLLECQIQPAPVRQTSPPRL